MRGTWQGSGTWQSSGLDLSGLAGVAALIGVAAAVMTVVLEFIWYIAAFLAAVLAGLVISAVVFRRRLRAHAAMLEATRAERHAVATARPQVSQGTSAPAIVNNYGPQYHIYGTPGPGVPAVPVIQGRVITGKEE